MTELALEVRDLNYAIPDRGWRWTRRSKQRRVIFDGIDLRVSRGSAVALLGPSGEGKTTLLRAIAGFVPEVVGKILMDGALVGDVPPWKRPLSMLYQNPTLHAHLSVENNALLSKPDAVSDAAARSEVKRLAKAFQCDHLLARRADATLSGGEVQRAALVRAFAYSKRLLLLDEPLKSALNLELRWELMEAIKQEAGAKGLSLVVVTHSFDEASVLCDQMAVMSGGKISQGTADALYNSPPTLAVAQVLGNLNLYELSRLRTGPEPPPIPWRDPLRLAPAEAEYAACRPSAVHLSPGVAFEVKERSFLGDFVRVVAEHPVTGLQVQATTPLGSIDNLDRVAVQIPAESWLFFDKSGNRIQAILE